MAKRTTARTRKWVYVEQEAKRLNGLGVRPIDIARRLGVDNSTIHRWMASGKLNRRTEARLPALAVTNQTPSEWAATVRKAYALDATDEQLLTLAETALGLSLDAVQSPSVRMTAAGRFQQIVRQLALVARKADEDRPAADVRPKREAIARADPRGILLSVVPH